MFPTFRCVFGVKKQGRATLLSFAAPYPWSVLRHWIVLFFWGTVGHHDGLNIKWPVSTTSMLFFFCLYCSCELRLYIKIDIHKSVSLWVSQKAQTQQYTFQIHAHAFTAFIDRPDRLRRPTQRHAVDVTGVQPAVFLCAAAEDRTGGVCRSSFFRCSKNPRSERLWQRKHMVIKHMENHPFFLKKKMIAVNDDWYVPVFHIWLATGTIYITARPNRYTQWP